MPNAVFNVNPFFHISYNFDGSDIGDPYDPVT